MNYLAIATTAIVNVFLAISPINAGDDKKEAAKEIEQRMIGDAKKAADKAEQDAKKAGNSNYDVKKSHDEHIVATEKAAADAAKAAAAAAGKAKPKK